MTAAIILGCVAIFAAGFVAGALVQDLVDGRLIRAMRNCIVTLKIECSLYKQAAAALRPQHVRDN